MELRSFFASFDSADLFPHGICLSWRPDLLWLHAVSDLSTAIAYYSIPIALLFFANRRRDLQFRWMFVLFGIFIMACGTTHVMGLWTLWVPDYLAAGIVKAVTAVSSVVTAIILLRLIPQALALPGPAQWEAINNTLRNEVAERQEAEAEVRRLNAQLEERVSERTAELEAANRQLAGANQEHRESEARIRRLIDSDIIGILFWNLDGTITDANESFLTLVGHSRTDLQSGKLRWTDMTPPEYRAANDHALQELASTGSCSPFEKEFIRADGSRVPVLVGAALFDASPNKGVAFVLDLTARKRAEDEIIHLNADLERRVFQRTCELETAKGRLQGITDNLFEGVLVVNREGFVAFANPSARRLLQQDGMPLEGRLIDEILSVESSSPARRPLSLPVEEVFCDDDALFVIPGGDTLSVAYACAPLLEQNAAHGTIISFRDIEALKAAQRESMQSSRLASVGQLAAGIAHEINTPAQYVGDNIRFCGQALDELLPLLQTVKTLARSAPLEADFAAAARQVATTADAIDLDFLLEEFPSATQDSLNGIGQIARIVLSMKEFAHPGTSGKSMTDINRAIENTLVVSHTAWKHAAIVATDLAPDLPPISCHPGEINQVILNLVINAVHAIEDSGKLMPGRIAISTRWTGDGVAICIEDNGTGVPVAIRHRIFDPFFTTKQVGKGTGQGLAISHNVVVTRHGGRLEVEGDDGTGAIFTVWLPSGGRASSALDLNEKEE